MKIRAILACLLWGWAFAGAKISFQHVDPIFLSGMRFVLAGLMLIPVLIVQKISICAEFKHWRFMLLFAFVQTFLQYGLFFMGLDKVPAATAAIIIGASPLFVAIMAHLSLANDKMTLRKILAIALGLVGVVFISLAKGDLTSVSSSFYAGVGILLLSNIIGSYTNIMVAKRRADNISPVFLTTFTNFFGGLMLLVAAFIVEKPELKAYPIEFYAALLWLSFIPAAAFSLWYGLLQRPGVKVSELNIWKFLVPVIGCALSWLLITEETPDVSSIVGIVVITAALLLLQLPDSSFKWAVRK